MPLYATSLIGQLKCEIQSLEITAMCLVVVKYAIPTWRAPSSFSHVSCENLPLSATEPKDIIGIIGMAYSQPNIEINYSKDAGRWSSFVRMVIGG